MYRLLAAFLAALVALACTESAAAQTQHAAKAPLRSVQASFHLHVQGAPASGTTFWVAYGPLSGRWGLVRLHQTGQGMYVATRNLPAAGRTTFAYLAGQGMERTRLGPTPGNPVVTIKVLGPMSPVGVGRTIVLWQAPVG